MARAIVSATLASRASCRRRRVRPEVRRRVRRLRM